MVAGERCPEKGSFVIGEERCLEKNSLLNIVAAGEEAGAKRLRERAWATADGELEMLMAV